MTDFHPHSAGHGRTGSKIIHIVRRVRTRPDPLSRLEVLRRPPDLALKNRGSSTPEPLRYNAGTDGDARLAPDLGIDESGRVGRHRSAETPSPEDVHDEMPVIGNVDVIRTPAAVGQQGRPSSRPADRSVTGGWVPGVSERLRRDGLDRAGNDIDPPASGFGDRKDANGRAHAAHEWDEVDWTQLG